jgi:hypothetical protein
MAAVIVGSPAGSVDEGVVARACPGDADAAGAASPLVPLIGSLLLEVCQPGQAVACTLLPSDARYAVRLPRQADKAVLLPREALERALVDPVARARARDLLRTAVDALGSRSAALGASLSAYCAALDVRSLPGPRCARCEGPLLPEDPIVVEEASRWHLTCPPAW